MKTDTTHIEPTLRESARKVFDSIGLSESEAIVLFYKHVAMHKALPFDVKSQESTNIEFWSDSELENIGKTVTQTSAPDNEDYSKW
ncbi:MAG: type II toxin-antitoxin system RelB/DinJ family antitoxin [Chloroherpetonaceae bacterium]